MVYVPILKTLEVLLNDEGILAEVNKSLSHMPVHVQKMYVETSITLMYTHVYPYAPQFMQLVTSIRTTPCTMYHIHNIRLRPIIVMVIN